MASLYITVRPRIHAPDYINNFHQRSVALMEYSFILVSSLLVRYSAMATGGVSYTVGGAAAPPTLSSATPTVWLATPIFNGFFSFPTSKWSC